MHNTRVTTTEYYHLISVDPKFEELLATDADLYQNKQISQDEFVDRISKKTGKSFVKYDSGAVCQKGEK